MRLRVRALQALLRLIVFVFEKFLPPPSGQTDSPPLSGAQRILVVRLDELGDMVLFSGFFRELRKARPNAYITLVASRPGAEIMAESPHLDRVVTFDPQLPSAATPLWMPIVARRFATRFLDAPGYDVAFNGRSDADTRYGAWLVYYSGAAIRIGFTESISQRKKVLNAGLDRLYTSVVNCTSTDHETERGRSLLLALNIDGDTKETEVWPRRGKRDRSFEEFIEMRNCGSPCVALGPSGGHSRLKAWPLEYFAEVTRTLFKNQVTVVLLGSTIDRELADDFRTLVGPVVVDLVGKTNLAETVTVLDRCLLYLGNDTGLLHIAVARGIPTVSMFGSSPASVYGPRGPLHRILSRNLSCSPPFEDGYLLPNAYSHGLKTERCVMCIYNRPLCMREIQVTSVVSACERALGGAALFEPGLRDLGNSRRQSRESSDTE